MMRIILIFVFFVQYQVLQINVLKWLRCSIADGKNIGVSNELLKIKWFQKCTEILLLYSNKYFEG